MPNLQKIFLRTGTGFVFIFAFVAVAQATEIQFNDDISRASMSALINKVTASASAGDRNITVHLNSGGGDLVAALRAAQVLKQYGVNTSASNDCSSACTVLFAAGRIRTASSGSTFMFHAVHVERKLKNDWRQAYIKKYAALWLSAVRSAPPRLANLLESRHILIDGEQTFSGRELRSYGYVNN